MRVGRLCPNSIDRLRRRSARWLSIFNDRHITGYCGRASTHTQILFLLSFSTFSLFHEPGDQMCLGDGVAASGINGGESQKEVYDETNTYFSRNLFVLLERLGLIET